jgi:hypothetical protein
MQEEIDKVLNLELKDPALDMLPYSAINVWVSIWQ